MIIVLLFFGVVIGATSLVCGAVTAVVGFVAGRFGVPGWGVAMLAGLIGFLDLLFVALVVFSLTGIGSGPDVVLFSVVAGSGTGLIGWLVVAGAMAGGWLMGAAVHRRRSPEELDVD